MAFRREFTLGHDYTGSKEILYSTPRMFTVAVVRRYITNTPPIIDTEIISCIEDRETLQKLKYHDSEGDHLIFSLKVPPHHGSANVSSDGVLLYHPDVNYDGVDSILLTATEVLPPDFDVQTRELTVRLDLNISSVNDPPVSFFQTGFSKLISSSDEPIHRIYLEGNQTEHMLGGFWIADVDQLDTLHLLQKDTSDTSVNFSLITTPMNIFNGVFDDLAKLYSVSTISNHGLNLMTERDYHGNINFSILAVDDLDTYSPLLTIEVFVLINPCYQGRCASTSTGPSCSHPTRAGTFNPYRCQCGAGYEGEFCEVEIDECLKATCPLLYDCLDRVAGYSCYINAPVIITIIICILLPMVGYLIWRRYKRMNGRIKSRSPFQAKSVSSLFSGIPLITFRTIPNDHLEDENTDAVDSTTTTSLSNQSPRDGRVGIFKRLKKIPGRSRTWSPFQATSASSSCSWIPLISFRTIPNGLLQDETTDDEEETVAGSPAPIEEDCL